MEIVLAAALVVLLLGMFVGTFSTWYDSERMPEGARRLESILRLARAEACASGRRIRLTFDDETLDAAIVWEPKPLEEPGTFVPHSAANWAHQLPNELVRVSRCERTGSSALETLTFHDSDELASEDGHVLQPINFYPDGSCDSAVIEMTGRDDRETRTALIELDGLVGTIRLRILTPTELEEYFEEAEG